jgi:hypothetical protein
MVYYTDQLDSLFGKLCKTIKQTKLLLHLDVVQWEKHFFSFCKRVLFLFEMTGDSWMNKK